MQRAAQLANPARRKQHQSPSRRHGGRNRQLLGMRGAATHARVRSREWSSSGWDWDGTSACSNSSQQGVDTAAGYQRVPGNAQKLKGFRQWAVRGQGAHDVAGKGGISRSAGACLVALRGPSPPCRRASCARVWAGGDRSEAASAEERREAAQHFFIMAGSIRLCAA